MLNATAVAAAHFHPFLGFGWLFLLIPLLLLIVVLVVLLIIVGRRWRRAGWANGNGPGGPVNAARQAEGTLAERFAKGDIDEVEYRARLEVIRANAGTQPS